MPRADLGHPPNPQEHNPMSQFSVKVSRRVARRVVGAGDELTDYGVGVRALLGRTAKCRGCGSVWDTINHVWLVFNVATLAYNNWPTIRKILVNAGLTKNEIITLGLSKHIRTKKRGYKVPSKR